MRLFLFAWLFAISIPSTAVETCPTIEGDADLLKKGSIVLIGEWHGTVETPDTFATLTCRSLQMGHTVHVALEYPPTWLTALESFLQSEDTEKKGVSRFLDAAGWKKYQDAAPDGRTSEAMLKMLRDLQKLSRTYPKRLVISTFDSREWEAPRISGDFGMASWLVKEIERQKADLTLVLTGELHARLSPNTVSYKPQPMAYLASQARPMWNFISLKVSAPAGEFWGCAARKCGPLKHPSPLPEGARKIDLFPSLNAEGFSGTIFIGKMTVSPPLSFAN